MAKWTLLDAVNHALSFEMRADPTVVVLGEDVGENGGVFRATEGLIQEFGPQRVIDTPLAESVIVGAAIGMATQGLRPIPELQFMGFIYPAVDQIISHAARLRNRTRGRLSCPMVIRAPYGGGIHAPEHHSESTEAMFAHMPRNTRGGPVLPRPCLRLITGCDTQSRSGNFSGTETYLSTG